MNKISFLGKAVFDAVQVPFVNTGNNGILNMKVKLVYINSQIMDSQYTGVYRADGAQIQFCPSQ